MRTHYPGLDLGGGCGIFLMICCVDAIIAVITVAALLAARI